MELYRTGPNGASTLVAQLNDTGKNGDRKPGDKIFSTTLTLYEATPSAFGFQVSATFTGKNKVWGQIQQFVALATTSIPVSLPPDPGEAGKATLQGIDSDADGVRDDVQRYIVFSSPDSERKREALLQSAKASQSALLGSSQKPLAVQAINAYLQGLDCLNYSVSIDEETSLRVSLRSAILNTRDRTIAWMEANRQFSGQKITSKFEPTTLRQACVTDPETLRN